MVEVGRRTMVVVFARTLVVVAVARMMEAAMSAKSGLQLELVLIVKDSSVASVASFASSSSNVVRRTPAVTAHPSLLYARID